MKKSLIFGSFAAAAAMAAASPAYAGTCPATGSATDCNLLITINAGGTVTVTNPSNIPYDGIEDQLVGVVNNSGSAITSLTLSGSDIFGFDSDGIQTFGSTAPSSGLPSGYIISGYEGPDNYFNIMNSGSGTVNFINGIATGGSSYFSLEGVATVAGQGIGITVGSGVPEPSTWAMMLLGFGAIGTAMRTRKRRQLATA